MFLRRIHPPGGEAFPSLLALATLLVVLSACGFGQHSSTPSATTQAARQQKAQAAFSAMGTCLSKAGYHMAGPPPEEVPANAKVVSNNGADDQMRSDPGYKKAYDRCATSTGFKQFASSASGKQPSAKDIQKSNQRILKVYTCMRQKGWTLADPTKDSRGSLSPPMPPSDAQQDPARRSQFGNDLNSCFKANGGGGVVSTQQGPGSGGVSLGG